MRKDRTKRHIMVQRKFSLIFCITHSLFYCIWTTIVHIHTTQPVVKCTLWADSYSFISTKKIYALRKIRYNLRKRGILSLVGNHEIVFHMSLWEFKETQRVHCGVAVFCRQPTIYGIYATDVRYRSFASCHNYAYMNFDSSVFNQLEIVFKKVTQLNRNPTNFIAHIFFFFTFDEFNEFLAWTI